MSAPYQTIKVTNQEAFVAIIRGLQEYIEKLEKMLEQDPKWAYGHATLAAAKLALADVLAAR